MANREYIVDIDIDATSYADSIDVELEDDSTEVMLNDDYTSYRVLKSYNALTDKPSINGVTLVGDITVDGDKHYTHIQATPSSEWMVTHNLGKYPSVEVVDSAGTVVVGEYTNIDTNTMLLTFSGAFSGKAYFN